MAPCTALALQSPALFWLPETMPLREAAAAGDCADDAGERLEPAGAAEDFPLENGLETEQPASPIDAAKVMIFQFMIASR